MNRQSPLSRLKSNIYCDRYKVLRHLVDADWYLAKNPDVAEAGVSPFYHFVQHGWAERRDPCPTFSMTRYLNKHPELAGADIDSFAKHFTANLDAYTSYNNRQRKLALEVSDAQKLIIFFNVARNLIGGGMLSINRFVENSTQLFSDIDEARVVMSGVPLAEDAVEHTYFRPAAPQIAFNYLAANCTAEDVWILIPEVFAVEFGEQLTSHERQWLLSRRNLHVVILNQNNDLMPAPALLQERIFGLSAHVLITTAHRRYCTERTASLYGVSLKQLTPFLPPIRHVRHQDKARVVMLSSDEITRCGENISREEVVRELQRQLPDFRFVTVQDMSLEDYLELAATAMFSLTFGEGLDGYFIEPILGGGVSFAVYNSTFFPEQFADGSTLYLGWKQLMREMPAMIRRIADSSELYEEVASKLAGLINTEYSSEKSRRDLQELFQGQVDVQPTPLVLQAENDTNIKRELALNYGFKFFDLNHGVKSVLAPDGVFVHHLGGEFYSVLYEVYVRQDYDFSLDPNASYVLVDIGSNIGLVTLYLLNKFKNIKKSYAFEPAKPSYRLALKNFSYNGMKERACIKQIGLSDSFSIKALEFIPDWSTAFSTDDDVLLPFLQQSTKSYPGERQSLEVEVVSARSELSKIVEDNPDEKIIIKCDVQGAEFAIFRDLASTGLLHKVDQIIVESHFHDPQDLIDSFTAAGFAVNSRLDSAANQVYTITAHRYVESSEQILGTGTK